MITLEKILNSQSTLLQGKRAKLVRHKPSDRDVEAGVLQNRSSMLKYQEEQRSDVFSDCDYIISFFAEKRGNCRFFGVFRVKKKPSKIGDKFFYSLEEIQDFKELVDRLVIDWGDAARVWIQRYETKGKDKEVVQILQRGNIGPFSSLLDFTLDFSQLRKLFLHPDGNPDWKHHLSAVKGVYLILDNLTGQQYVGAAYGQGGIWGRWQNYVETDGHGGNKELALLLKKDPEYHRHFHFSVLQTLPSNTQDRDVTKIEKLYKNKLGSRMHGLNCN